MKQRLAEIWILVTDDKKKAGMLAGLVVVLFFMGVRGLLVGEPDSASAVGTAPSGLDQLLGGSLASTYSDLAGPDGAGLVAVPRPGRVTRDLFAIDEAYFPQTVQPEPSTPSGDKLGSGSSETEGVGPAESALSPEEKIAEEASAFELRSTLVGENPVAILVSGSEQHVVSQGDTVDGFLIVEIRSHEVLLEKDGITVAIERR